MDFLAVPGALDREIKLLNQWSLKGLYGKEYMQSQSVLCPGEKQRTCVIRGEGIEDVGQVVAMPPSWRPKMVRLPWSSEVLPGWFGR